MSQRSNKQWYCYTCQRYYHYLGIMRHRAMHRERREKVKMVDDAGDTWEYDFTAKAVSE